MENLALFLPLVLLIFGLFIGMLGAKYIKRTVVFLSFLAGLFLPIIILNLIIKIENFNTTTYLIIFIIGCLSAFLGHMFFEIGMFIVGIFIFSLVYIFFVVLTNGQFELNINNLIILAISGLTGGIVSSFLRKHILVVTTSFFGAIATLVGILTLLENSNFEIILERIQNNISTYVVLFFVVFLFFMLFQYGLVNSRFIEKIFTRKQEYEMHDSDLNTNATKNSYPQQESNYNYRSRYDHRYDINNQNNFGDFQSNKLNENTINQNNTKYNYQIKRNEFTNRMYHIETKQSPQQTTKFTHNSNQQTEQE